VRRAVAGAETRGDGRPWRGGVVAGDASADAGAAAQGGRRHGCRWRGSLAALWVAAAAARWSWMVRGQVGLLDGGVEAPAVS
jgi:hypothetical protein